jgi:hypothetical protein
MFVDHAMLYLNWILQDEKHILSQSMKDCGALLVYSEMLMTNADQNFFKQM